MSDEHIVTVRILDREYKVKCPKEQEHDLQEAAIYVNDQMQKLREHSSTTHADQIAIVAALNICHEWMKLKKEKSHHIEIANEKLNALQARIEKAVGTEQDSLV